jgi:hypothetical protein
METATHQRDIAIKLARTHPTEALAAAHRVSEPWYRAQALAWVARYAPTNMMSERALAEARSAAQLAGDVYRQTAVLSWPIRAALEIAQHRLAKAMLEDAILLLPKIDPSASRAEAASLLFDACVVGGSEYWTPLIDTISKCCLDDAHWRTKRLHKKLRAFSAANGQEIAVVKEVPSNPQISAPFTPRRFFW